MQKSRGDNGNTKIEAFGLKIYDNIDGADKIVEQIVNETFSYKTQISSNISEEKYIYTNLFKLLSKKDLEIAADTEFEYYCNENGKKKQALQYRHMFIENLEDRDKITALFVYTNESNIVTRLQELDGHKVSQLVPVPIVIKNLLSDKYSKNSIIVNIERNTTITTLKEGKIYRVDAIDKGMKEILDNITLKESSYSKAYEICKNSTIYTQMGQSLQTEENDYMEDIMPTLYEIVTETKKIVENNGIEIEEIFITGLGTAINNIDLYFAENFEDQKCEILTPYFVNKNNIKLNIKDYIEVNSAISLALQGLNKETEEVNFKKESLKNRFKEILFSDVGKKNNNLQKKKSKTTNIKQVLGEGISGPLDKYDWVLIRIAYSLLLIIIIYAFTSNGVSHMITSKDEQVNEIINDSEDKISTLNKYSKLIDEKIEQYQSVIDKIDEANNNITEQYLSKNAIPNLLSEIMFAIPKKVQITSIQNLSEKHMIIGAESNKYEQLAYFIAKLKNDAILLNVSVTSEQKSDELVSIVIEGDLPY